MASIQSQFLSLPDSTVVHSGHGPDTTIGVERLTNPYLTGAFRLGEAVGRTGGRTVGRVGRRTGAASDA